MPSTRPRRPGPRLAAVVIGVPVVLLAGAIVLKTTLWTTTHVGAANDRSAPPRGPDAGPPAAATDARLMLTAARLGAGWYLQVPPEEQQPSSVATGAGAVAPLSDVKTVLQRAHLIGAQWNLDGLLVEDARHFATSSASAADAALFTAPNGFCHCNNQSVARSETVLDIHVMERTTSTSIIAAFSHGTRAYHLIVGGANSPAPVSTQQFNAIVSAAVTQATRPAAP